MHTRTFHSPIHTITPSPVITYPHITYPLITTRLQIPQQLNGCDCGMFTLLFANYAGRDAPLNFKQVIWISSGAVGSLGVDCSVLAFCKCFPAVHCTFNCSGLIFLHMHFLPHCRTTSTTSACRSCTSCCTCAWSDRQRPVQ